LDGGKERVGLIVEDKVVALGKMGIRFVMHDQQGDVTNFLQLGADLGTDLFEHDDEIDLVHREAEFGVFELRVTMQT
jgi:hypothetical protein